MLTNHVDFHSDNVKSRPVVKRSNHGHVYKFCSQKCGRIVELESGLEYDLAVIYEFDPSVICYQEQPLALEIEIDSVSKTVYPDFLVFRDDGSATIEEVKPYDKSQKPEIIKKFLAEKEIAESCGYQFRLITDKQIRSDLRLQNSRKLLPYRRIRVGGILRETVMSALRWRPMSAHEMLSQIPGLDEKLLLALLAQGYLATDLSTAFSADSFFSLISRHSQLSAGQQHIWERRCV